MKKIDSGLMSMNFAHFKMKLPAWGAVFIYLENREGGSLPMALGRNGVIGAKKPILCYNSANTIFGERCGD